MQIVDQLKSRMFEIGIISIAQHIDINERYSILTILVTASYKTKGFKLFKPKFLTAVSFSFDYVLYSSCSLPI